MGTLNDKSDDEYSYIGDKGDIGFIDIDNCQSVCSYNPAEESEIVNISVPFPLIDGKPQSGIVGETMFDLVTLKNTTDEPLDLWSVKIYDSKPEDSFTISLMKPPTADSDQEYIEDFMELVSLDEKVLRTDQALTIWLSCKPKEIGLHSAAIHFSVGDEVIERLIFLLAEDKISKSLSSSRPYQRSMGKKQDIVNRHAPERAYVAGRRPSQNSNRGPRKIPLPEHLIPVELREMLNNHVIPDAVNEGLTMKNYGPFFKNLLAMEEIKLEEDMRAYGMEGVTMKRNRRQMLSLEVPGLAEKRPSLLIGDFIFVKLVNADEKLMPNQGHIHCVEAEEILLKFDPKFHRSHRESDLYNVQFTYNRTNMRRLNQTVETAACLERNLLFPSVSSKVRLGQYKELTPICSDLNEEQRTAIDMILVRQEGPPYVIHGPPGTGKTKTLIEAILQIYRVKRNARILACAPSNSAADHILDRLISEESVHIQNNEIFRLNARTRPFEDVNPNHIKYCSFEDDVFVCPPRRDLEQYKIIVSTYSNSFTLHAEGIRRGHFSYIFLDEAGQASEPDTMVPIAHLYSRNTVLILAGDPRQLGPVVFSKEAEELGLGTSYLERLFECDLYLKGDTRFMTKLVKNYRTHKAILQLPSELFYDGELIPCKEVNKDSSTSWEGIIPDKDFPLLFIGIQGCDEREGSNPSWFNRIEASKTAEITKSLIEEQGIKEEDIGVIAPYRKQVSKIRDALECHGNLNVKVGSVEQFQGQEREVIIISTVRSTIKHNEFDKVHYLGFLSNPRRFNVAITRAKSLVIVIGNPHIISKDENWNKLLWYCADNGSYKGCFLPKPDAFADEGFAETDHTEGVYPSYGADYFEPSGSNWDEGGGWEPSQDHCGVESGWNEPCIQPPQDQCGVEDGWNEPRIQPPQDQCDSVENGWNEPRIQPPQDQCDSVENGWNEPRIQPPQDQCDGVENGWNDDFQPTEVPWE